MRKTAISGNVSVLTTKQTRYYSQKFLPFNAMFEEVWQSWGGYRNSPLQKRVFEVDMSVFPNIKHQNPLPYSPGKKSDADTLNIQSQKLAVIFSIQILWPKMTVFSHAWKITGTIASNPRGYRN